MSALEVLEHLREANPKELAMVRDTTESLLSADQLTSSEDREIVEALEESEAQFARGEGIPAAEAWRRLGI
jgi:predicted transcriptional regulator